MTYKAPISKDPCKIQDCIKPVMSRGYCKYHYKKFVDIPKEKAKKQAAQEEQKRQQVVAKTTTAKAAAIPREKLEKLFLTPCRTEQDLKNYIKYFFNLYLPDCKVSRYADTTPFHAIWEAYDICVNKNNPQNIHELLYVAGRGSGKTLGMAIAELLIVLHDQRDTAHVGAILSQAKRCYEYQQKFLLSDRIRLIVSPPKLANEEFRILEKSNMEKSVFNIGGEKVTLEVLPCTLKACLTKDTIIATPTGNRNAFSLIKGEKILSPLGEVEVIYNEIDEQECLRIELDDGRIIEGTLDHKVWTTKGWVALKDLSLDDDVLLSEHVDRV